MTTTLRSMAGASPATALDAASTALVLIDYQLEYVSGRLPLPDAMAAIAQASRLLALADARGLAVIHVQHVGPAGGLLFAEGSRGAEIHPALQPAPRHQLLRKNRSGSFAGTDLHARLQAGGIRTLVVAGLMTHMCVSTMVREARQFGADSYQVLLAADACATRDLPGWQGGVLEHRQLHQATLAALADNFAEVLSTDAILALGEH